MGLSRCRPAFRIRVACPASRRFDSPSTSFKRRSQRNSLSSTLPPFQLSPLVSFPLNYIPGRRSASSFRGAVSRWKTGDLLGLLEEGRWKRASRFKLALGTARPFLPGSGRFVTADGVWRSETVWEARRTEASLDERPFFPLLSSKFLPGQAWPPSRHNQRRRIGREIFLPTAEISFPDFLQKSGPRFSSPRPNSPEIYHIPPRNSSKLGWVCSVGKNRCGIFG